MNILCLTSVPPKDFTLPPGIDLLEWRIDLTPIDEEVVQPLKGQWMATLRHISHGGQFDGSDDEREEVLQKALDLGATWVDVEAEFPLKNLPESQCLRSVHLKTSDPIEVKESFERLRQCPGAVKKWVRPTPYTEDLCEEEKHLIADSTPCVIIHSAAGGQWSRARPQGHQWNYLAMDSERRSGEGQLTWAENLRLADGPLYGIIGNPLGHSLSPFFQNRMRRILGLDGAFVKVPLEDPAAFFKTDVFQMFSGFSVTSPHKQTVISVLNEVSEAVKNLDACNTLIREGDRWIGENTDFLAVKKLIENHRVSQDSPIAIIGCGGFGRAAAWAGLSCGHCVTLVNRSFDKAEQWATRFGCQAMALDNFSASDFPIIIQATSAEMSNDPCPIDTTHCQDNSLLIESIYALHTQFLKKAPASCIKLDGKEIFQIQAQEQLRLWSGHTMPHTLGGLAMTS